MGAYVGVWKVLGDQEDSTRVAGGLLWEFRLGLWCGFGSVSEWFQAISVCWSGDIRSDGMLGVSGRYTGTTFYAAG